MGKGYKTYYQFQEKGRGNHCFNLRRKGIRKVKSFKKLLKKINQNTQCSQSRQSTRAVQIEETYY